MGDPDYAEDQIRQEIRHEIHQSLDPPTQRVLRWVVPVDDDPHEIGGGALAHVAARYRGEVEVWTVEWTDANLVPKAPKRLAQIFGTGHLIPEGAHYLGSTFDTTPRLVWHLFEVPRNTPPPVAPPLEASKPASWLGRQ